MKNSAIIVAAGSGKRFGGEVPKQFKTVCGRPLLSWAIERFEKASQINNIVLVVAEDYLLYTSEHVVDPYGFSKVSKIIKGGETRQESVLNGLKAIPTSTSVVAIHDGARVLIQPNDIDRAIETAKTERAVIIASKTRDTMKRVVENHIISTVDRENLYNAETPQVFQYDLIMEAHKEAENKKVDFTDDASLIEQRGFKVTIVEPSGLNMKVTNSEDLLIVEAILKKETGQ